MTIFTAKNINASILVVMRGDSAHIRHGSNITISMLGYAGLREKISKRKSIIRQEGSSNSL